MEKQLIFKSSYIRRLEAKLEAGDIEQYKTTEFVYEKDQTLFYPNIDHSDQLLASLDSENDFTSAIKIYEAFEELEPIQASDKRLWTYLTHVELYPYMIKRWDGVINNKIENPVKYIKDHWFLYGESQTDFLRHALAGLWWGVYLSVDYDRIEKYELTKIFFRQMDFVTRTLGVYKLARHKEAVMGILEFINENDLLFKNNFEKKTRFITKYLNLLGGVKPLAYYDRDFFKKELKIIKGKIENI